MTSSHENGQQISSSKKLVSIIAPVYNEEAVIEEFIARLINAVAQIGKSYVFEFILINDEKYLTPSELQELSSMPSVSIGAHGMTHVPLTECDDCTLMNELVSSKKYIEDLIGRPVTTMSYPFGAVDRRVRDAVKRAGYLLAACSRFDINDASRDPLLLCRTEITGNDSVRVFQQKLHGDWDWYRWRRKDPASS